MKTTERVYNVTFLPYLSHNVAKTEYRKYEHNFLLSSNGIECVHFFDISFSQRCDFQTKGIIVDALTAVAHLEGKNKEFFIFDQLDEAHKIERFCRDFFR